MSLALRTFPKFKGGTQKAMTYLNLIKGLLLQFDSSQLWKPHWELDTKLQSEINNSTILNLTSSSYLVIIEKKLHISADYFLIYYSYGGSEYN